MANNICLDWIEESDNAIDERAGIQAACTLAQGRILIDYFKATTDNIYTSKNQSFVESMLYDLRQGYNNIERMVQQLGIKSFVDNLAGSFCDHLYIDDVSQLVNERLHTILTNRKI